MCTEDYDCYVSNSTCKYDEQRFGGVLLLLKACSELPRCESETFENVYMTLEMGGTNDLENSPTPLEGR